MKTAKIFLYPVQEEKHQTEQYLPRVLAACGIGKGDMEERKIREILSRTPEGKPYLIGTGMPGISVSHSGGIWACAVYDGTVGLDLQKMEWKGNAGEQGAAYAIRMAERFLHPEEAACVKESEALALQRFFRIWTAKESYVKYTGTGIRGNFADRSVLPERERDSFYSACGVWFRSGMIEAENGHFCLSLCTAEPADWELICADRKDPENKGQNI